jgi:hypothetical protein
MTMTSVSNEFTPDTIGRAADAKCAAGVVDGGAEVVITQAASIGLLPMYRKILEQTTNIAGKSDPNVSRIQISVMWRISPRPVGNDIEASTARSILSLPLIRQTGELRAPQSCKFQVRINYYVARKKLKAPRRSI